MRRYIIPPLIMATGIALSQVPLPVPDQQVKRTMPNDTKEMIDTEYKRLYEQAQQNEASRAEENERLKKELEALKAYNSPVSPAFAQPAAAVETMPSVASIEAEFGRVPSAPSGTRTGSFERYSAPSRQLSSGVQVFAVTSDGDSDVTVLPAGSWVRAKLMTGVQANSQYPYDVLMQLDYAYTGPNGSKIPLTGCLVLGAAKADLSIERVIISPYKLSCVRDNGQAYQRKVQGFVAGKDSSNGMTGIYDSKQGKVFLAAVLAGVVKGASEAYELAHTEQQVVTGAFGSQSVAKNFNGKFQELAVSKGVGNAAEMTTQWYLENAKALLPAMKVGSGEDLWIVMTDEVEVPDLRTDK